MRSDISAPLPTLRMRLSDMRTRIACAMGATAIVLGAFGIGAGIDYANRPTDTTVCYESQSFPGVWLSDYSESGYCTFGMPLDTPATPAQSIR